MNPIARYLNALAALVAVNARMKLLGRSPLLPVILVLLSLMPVVLWRLVYWWFSQTAAVESIWIDAYTVYAVFASTLYMQFYVPVLAIFLGMSTFSEEIENETIVYLLLRPLPRFVIVAGKFLAYLAAASFLLGASQLGCYLIVGSIPDAGLITNNLDVLLHDWLVFTLGLAAYGGVLMTIGVLFKLRLFAGLFFIFVWDPAAAYLPGSAYQFTIRHYLFSLFSHDESPLPAQQDVSEFIKALLSTHPDASAFGAVAVLFALIALCIAITTWVVKYRQLRIGQLTEG